MRDGPATARAGAPFAVLAGPGAQAGGRHRGLDADTEENQARYPQPDSQADGVGFALACVVVVICLATGAVLDAAIGAHSSKGTGEFEPVARTGGRCSSQAT